MNYEWHLVLVATISPRQCSILPIFHAVTGCDTVSAFAGTGNTGWETWKAFPEGIEGFWELRYTPADINEETMAMLGSFVALMYYRNSDTIRVNDARKQLFAQKSRTLDDTPHQACLLPGQRLEPGTGVASRCHGPIRLGVDKANNQMTTSLEYSP